MPARLEILPLRPKLGAEISAMHYAVNDYDGYRRYLHRTTIQGAAPLPA